MVDKTETSITTPIEIKDNSSERVAFDLMKLIAGKEHGNSFSPDKDILKEQGDRLYWLRLYDQCKRIVGSGRYTAESAISSSSPKND